MTADAVSLPSAIYAENDLGLPSILVGFQEAGQVDVAEVYFPTMDKTNFQWALVNAAEGPQLATVLNFRPNLLTVPSTRAILARYP